MSRGRPTNRVRQIKFRIKLSELYWEYLVPKKFRTVEVFGIILKNELKKL
jgi:hypothetical protein